MQCSSCNAVNDPDARFCTECGKPVNGSQSAPKGRRAYLSALLLVPVIILAAAIGYYKYFLPQGIAAVVNGENILLSELDAAAVRQQGEPGAGDPGFRYQLLNGLITERLMHQEARKAGFTVSNEELAAAVEEARKSAGVSGKDFDQDAAFLYGSMKNFEDQLARRMTINKYIAGRIIPPNSDARAAGIAMNRWVQEISGKASVRVALAEQWSGAECGCCNKRADAAAAAPRAAGGCRMAKAAPPEARTDTPSRTTADQASQAALSYWHAKHGKEPVTAKVTDFGCHMQVDIIRDNQIIGSLQYQGGSISE